MTTLNNQYEEIKEQLVKTAKKAYREKLMAGTSGNMSIFCKEQGPVSYTHLDVYKRQVVMDMPWGRILSAKAYPLKDGEADWDNGIDLSGYIGTAYQEEVFQFSGLTEYNHKRYFTGQQARRLWWTAPEGRWQIYVFTEVVMTGFKYFNTYVDTMNPKAVRHYLDTTHEPVSYTHLDIAD